MNKPTPEVTLKNSLLSKAKQRKILKLTANLARELDENGMVLFSGGCNDDAVLVHRETGIVFGYEDSGVWMGGDYNEYPYGKIMYCPFLSTTSGDFIERLEGKK